MYIDPAALGNEARCLCSLLHRCIPVKVTAPQDGIAGVQVLLVSSRNGKGLGFPKVLPVLPPLRHIVNGDARLWE